MPGFTNLPPELLEEIVSLVLVNEQSTPSKSDNSNQAKNEDRYPDKTLAKRANHLEAYSLSKVITHSFTEGLAAIDDYKVPDMEFQYKFIADLYRHRVRKGALLSLALSCRALRDIVEPILYRMVELKSGASDRALDSNPLTSFLCSISKQRSLRAHVRELSFRSNINMVKSGYEQSKDGRLENLQNAVNLLEHFALSSPSEKELEIWHPDIQQAMLFYLLPNLHAVKITLETECPSIWDEFLALFFSNPKSITFPSALQNLRELSIIFCGTDTDSVYGIEGILPALLLPNLHTLYIGSGLVASVRGDDISYDDLATYKRKSNIKKIVFEFSGIGAEALTLMLSIPRELESFTFNFCGCDLAVGCVEPSEIAAALLPQRQSLRKLEIRGNSDHRGGHGEPFPSGFLTGFSALEELKIAVALFLHRGSDGTRWLWTNPPGWMQSMLPRGLRSLKLYLYNDWSIFEWAQELASVFEHKDILCPLLRDVYLEYWTSAEDFLEPNTETIRRNLVDFVEKGAREAGIQLIFDVDENLDTMIG